MKKRGNRGRKPRSVVYLRAVCIGLAVLDVAVAALFCFKLGLKLMTPIMTAAVVLMIVINVEFAFFVLHRFVTPLGKLESALEETGEEGLLTNSPMSMFDGIIKAINNEVATKMMMVQTEMSALQNQINPHFLYNTLEAIRSSAYTHGVYDVAEMTEALATLFRYGINRPGEMVTLSEELENVRNYLTIQKYRFGDKINIVWKLEDADEKAMASLMPVLTVQPIVENAIQHGLEVKVGGGTLTVTVFLTQSKLVVEVADDGAGIEAEKLGELLAGLHENRHFKGLLDKSETRGHGIALMNVDRRLKYYYGQESGLSIASTEGCGTSVSIMLPR